MILEIFLPIPINKSFYYKFEKQSKNHNLKIGSLIKINFRSKIYVGVVWKIKKTILIKKEIKEIEEILPNIFLREEVIKSISFISNYTCNPISSIVKLFISGFSLNNYEKILENFSALPNNFFENKYIGNLILNDEQKIVLEKINSLRDNSFNVFVIDGITSSGKTRVYMHAIIEKLKKGFQCLILVPEKILTKQWVNELYKDFGFEPEIYHSSISINKRNTIWIGTLMGKISLVIGTRSALFLPFKNLGMIVIDEEHDISFKQEEGVVINVKDLAIVRAKYTKCVIILSSATPSIETLFNCKKKGYIKGSLKKRVGDSILPKINIIDMKLNQSEGNKWVSKELELEINNTLKENKQSLIFLNKRGYAPVTICKNCGTSKMCKNCDFPLVIHKKYKKNEFDRLICHFCNYKEIYIDKCSECSKENVFISLGVGIERIFEEIRPVFPKAKICLLSSDLIRSNKNFEKILDEILNNKIDIIIGTQITSKGHHFPYLKTVGILNIDNLLNGFDIRSTERTYQLITQVSGRAGRSSKNGKVLIQTYQPEHPLFKSIKNADKEKYFKWEIDFRKKNNYPPYSSMISIIVQGKDKSYLSKISEEVVTKIKKKFSEIQVFGPAAAIIFKLKNNYRYRILIKFKKDYYLVNDLKKYLLEIKSNNRMNLKIDVDPQSFF